MQRIRNLARATAAWLAATFDVRDAMLGVGLVLLAFGLAKVWAPAALIVPGAVLTYVAIRGTRGPAEGAE